MNTNVDGWTYALDESAICADKHRWTRGEVEVLVGDLAQIEDSHEWGLQATTDDGEVLKSERFDGEEKAVEAALKWMSGLLAVSSQTERAADVIMQAPSEHPELIREALNAYFQLWPEAAADVLKGA